MNTINYLFFEEYKRLSILCNDIYNSQTGLTDYINDLKSISSSLSPQYASDLKMLIHLRSIRNQLAHQEGAFEEPLCAQNDIEYIQTFYNCILTQTDPLAVIQRQKNLSKKSVSKKVIEPASPIPQPVPTKKTISTFSFIPAVIIATLLILFCITVLISIF